MVIINGEAMTHRKFWKQIAGILLVPLLAFMVFAEWMNPWSKMDCYTREIDIQTGRERYTKYRWYRVVERAVTDTWITSALGDEVTGLEPEWQLVVTIGANTNHSPHYAYHGALSDSRQLAWIVEEFNVTDEAKRAMGRNMLILWQFDGDDRLAADYKRQIQHSLYNDGISEPEQYGLTNLPALLPWLEENYRSPRELGPWSERLEAAIARYKAEHAGDAS